MDFDGGATIAPVCNDVNAASRDDGRPLDLMPSWIEFHDSQLISGGQSDLDVSIFLDAYVHRWEDGDPRRGTGWMQQVRLTLERAVASLPMLGAPAPIADGEIRMGPLLHSNLVPMPIKSDQPVSLRSVRIGNVIRVHAGVGPSIDLWPFSGR
jgi:hypothetical protein